MTRTTLSMLLALAVTTPRWLHAQVDVIRGRVSSTEGEPLAQVQVTATAIPGGATRTARTGANGNFQIVFPGGQGDYMMGFGLVGYSYRRFEVKRTADQDVLIADARLSRVQLDTVTIAASVQQRVARGTTSPDVGGTEQLVDAEVLPLELQGSLSALAASLPGVLLMPGLDGAPDGFSVLGLGADQNSLTLNGLVFEGAGLPRDATVSASLSTSPFDPGRGGFSGAQLDVQSGQGSNWRTRGMSLVVNAPQLQWTDRAARALGTEFTNLSLGGVASGPIQLNKSFYTLSYQLGRQSRPNFSLLNTDPIGFQTAGLATDSVSRFLGIIQQRGVPTSLSSAIGSRVSDNGSFFGGIEMWPPNSVSGSSYSLAFNGAWGRQSALGGGATTVPTAAGQRTNWSGSAQLRHNGYFGMLLVESAVGVHMARNYGTPYLELPAGRVRVNSLLGDGTSGVQNLVFGGNQSFSTSDRTIGGSLQNTLSWFDDNNKHRIKLTSELRLSSVEQNQSNNLLGTFTFNSLEDLESGRPASFSRMLTARQRSSGLVAGSIALGDSYLRTENLQLQYGLRLDASRFIAQPAYNADVEAAFGARNDIVPRFISVSPRIGFSWTVGTASEVEAFAGAARVPRTVIRGGVGMFANSASAGQIGSALDNTGLPGGAQQLNCVGEATPVPDWRAFGLNTSAVPDRCADGTGGTVFSNSAPNVVLYGKGFQPQRSVRSNLALNRSMFDDRLATVLEATYALNLNQQQTVDLNFAPTVRFGLDSEMGRPVFVQPASIVEATGVIASRDARVTQRFARVSELRSNLQSRTAQGSIRVSPVLRPNARFGWNAAYTFTQVREQFSGFSSTAGNPLSIEWADGGQGPHQITYGVRYNFFNTVQVSWNGQFRSGSAFTPMIAGDVNGDGHWNDRAFIPDPAGTGDATLRAELAQLLDQTGSATAACLRRQFGRITERNSCRGPWSSTAALNVTIDRAKFRLPQRTALQFSLSNPLGAADLAINGSGNLRGWGQTASPDPSLLYVRGFNATTGEYRYEVNKRFGATRPQFLTLRAPVSMTVSLRVDFGATAEQQSLAQTLDYGRRTPGTRHNANIYRRFGASGLPNPLTPILRAQDSLRLTTVQADSIAAMNRSYAYRIDSLWTPTSRRLADTPARYDEDEAYHRYLEARRLQVDILIEMAKAVNELLTPSQLRKLSPNVTNHLDPRYLLSIRDGTGLYVGGRRSR